MEYLGRCRRLSHFAPLGQVDDVVGDEVGRCPAFCAFGTSRRWREGSGGWRGWLVGAGRRRGRDGLVAGAGWEGAGRRTPCARESCDSHSSTEPAASWFGEGALGEARVRSLACPVLVGRAGRRTPCARESCDSHSSTEPAALWFGGGREQRRSGRRTPCERESCNSDSSPEPSAAFLERACWEVGVCGVPTGRGMICLD